MATAQVPLGSGFDNIADLDVDSVEVAAVDLADPSSIDAFTDAFIASGRSLRVLVNNAGIMMVPLARDDRGYDRTDLVILNS